MNQLTLLALSILVPAIGFFVFQKRSKRKLEIVYIANLALAFSGAFTAYVMFRVGVSVFLPMTFFLMLGVYFFVFGLADELASMRMRE